LAQAGDRAVHLHINSPGGDVFEARAMAAAIVAHKGKVTSHVDGLAASAGHLPGTGRQRGAHDRRRAIHRCTTAGRWPTATRPSCSRPPRCWDKIDGTIAADYARRTGATLDQVQAWMDAETWFNAAEALDAKFIDAVDPNTKADANAQARAWNLSAYTSAPKPTEPKPEPQPDLQAQVAAQLAHNRNRLKALHSI